VELTPLGFDLRAGAQILVQITRHWRKHRGNAFRERHIELDTDESRPHGGAFCLVKSYSPEGSDAEVATEVLDMGFHYVIKLSIERGTVADGQTLALYLADPGGMPVEIPKIRGTHVMQVLVSDGAGAPFRYTEEPAKVFAHGRPAEGLRLRCPSTAPAGSDCDLRIVAVDAASENPASSYDAKLRIWREEAEDWATVRHTTEDRASSVTLGAGDAQFTYYQAHDGDNALCTHSNPMGRPEDFGGLNVYLGDLHVHPLGLTEAELREPFEFGRWWSNLDFYSIVWQHNSTNFKFDQEKWLEHLEMLEEYNAPGEVLTIPGTETYLVQGHRIAYFPSIEEARRFTVAWDRGPQFDLIDPMAAGTWPEAPALWAALEGIDALTIPHHPCFIWPEDWDEALPERERCVEIYSRWGTNEVGGGGCSVQAALRKGHRLGFVANSDNQLAQPGNGPFHMNKGRGLTGVLAPELTRKAVYEALWARRCYATSGEQMLVSFALGEAPMGSEVALQDGPREFVARAAGTRKLTSVELVRNNEVVARVEPNAMTFDGALTDDVPIESALVEGEFADVSFCWYYLRVTQEDGHMAWASPIWMA